MYLAQCLAYNFSSNVNDNNDDDNGTMIMTALRNWVNDGCGVGGDMISIFERLT